MRTGLVEFEKLSFSWIRLVKALDFEVVIEVQIFFKF